MQKKVAVSSSPPLPSYLEIARLFGWATAALSLRTLRGMIDAVAPRERRRRPFA